MQYRDFFRDENQQQEVKPVIRDFFGKPPEPNENIAQSIGYAPFRVLEDVYKSGLQAYNKIPEYWQKAKTEVPGLLNLLNNNPQGSTTTVSDRESAKRQAKAGFAEFGQGFFNAPHDIANYLSERLHLISPETNKIIQMGRMPADTETMINERYGVPSRPGESLLRGMTRNTGLEIPALAVTKSALSTAKNAFNRIHPEKVITEMQNNHDLMYDTATNIFTDVGKEVSSRKVPPVPLRADLIDDISDHLKYLKITPTGKKMISDAKSGNYEALRTLQSDLFKEANNFSSPLSSGSDKQIAKVLRTYRNEINDSIINHLKNTGHIDLAADLNQARRIYHDLQKTYYGKKTPAAIKNMVNPESRKKPKNIMNVLNEESIPMERLKGHNPLAEKQSIKYQKKLNAIQNLKNLYNASKIAGGAGAVSGALYYGPELYHDFRNSLNRDQD